MPGDWPGTRPRGATACHARQVAQQRLVSPTRITFLNRATTVGGSGWKCSTRSNLRELEQVVKYTSQMPGQRTVISGSPGFLLGDDQFQLERIVDRALRLQVVISSLDPRGLPMVVRQGDASRTYVPVGGASGGACIAWTKTGKCSQETYWHRLRKVRAANSFTTTTI